MSPTGQTIADLAARLDEARQEMTGGLAELRRQLAAARAALHHAEEAPPPPDELLATAQRLVAEAGERWRREQGPAIVRALAGAPPAHAQAGRETPARRPHLALHIPLDWPMLCAVLPAQVVAAIEATIAATAYQPGPPEADRPALVERLRRELADLESREEQLVDQLIEAGLVVEHRPEVRQRREQEARRRQLDEERRRDAERRQAALDRERAARPAAVRSSYLTRNR